MDIAKQKFITIIKNLDGTVIGEYVTADVLVEVLCKRNHECHVTPKNIKRSKKILCKYCDLIEYELIFKENIENLGGIVIGEYVTADVLVEVLCKRNHECSVTPKNIKRSKKIACEYCDIIEYELIFKENIENLGGTVIGKFVKTHLPVDILCKRNHECHVIPNNLKKFSCKQCKKIEYENLVELLL
jgi:hypothetical protein